MILTAQPGHTGIVNFELWALQVLHGEMRTEQQVGFIFRDTDTELISVLLTEAWLLLPLWSNISNVLCGI